MKLRTDPFTVGGTNASPMIAGLNQIGKGKAQQFDIHGFKEDTVGQGSGKFFNVATDSEDGSVWLTPVKAGNQANIPTPYNSLEDVMAAYPKE